MVQVSVFNEPELAVSGRVRKDGTLQCPLIGQIRIAGLGQQAAARAIQEAYRKDYLVNPEVNLFVSQFTVQRVTVLGQVMRPGSHDLPAENSSRSCKCSAWPAVPPASRTSRRSR